MSETVRFFLIWLGVMGVLTFLLFGWDKLMAKLGSYRIPERTLLICAALGGALGGTLAMALFRHKIRKPAFHLILHLALAAHLALLIYAVFRT